MGRGVACTPLPLKLFLLIYRHIVWKIRENQAKGERERKEKRRNRERERGERKEMQ